MMPASAGSRKGGEGDKQPGSHAEAHGSVHERPGVQGADEAGPGGTAEHAGVELDEEDQRALRSVDWGQPDEQLKERVSKARYRS